MSGTPTSLDGVRAELLAPLDYAHAAACEATALAVNACGLVARARAARAERRAWRQYESQWLATRARMRGMLADLDARTAAHAATPHAALNAR